MNKALCAITLVFLMTLVLVMSAYSLAENGQEEQVGAAVEPVVEELGEFDLFSSKDDEETEQEVTSESEVLLLTEQNAVYYYEINDWFPDAAFAQYVRQSFDLDGDGYLSDEELEDVKEIDVDEKGIVSLSGIELFENLEVLTCNKNRLRELDVSRNTYLEALICRENQMESLWLPTNGILSKLICDYNKLSYLDLANNTLLDTLWINYNNLEQIDISGFNDLINLMDMERYVDSDTVVWDNNSNASMIIDRNIYVFWSGEALYAPLVVEIDDSAFPVKDFREYVLSEFDISCDGWLDKDEITAVTDITLRTYEDIEEGANEMNCPNLEGIEYFINLSSLNCCDCGVQSLNVSKNKNLYWLDCSDNKLSSLNVRNNTQLGHLYCYSNKLKSLDVSKNTKLLWLGCASNAITKLNVTKNKRLEFLSCYSNKLKKLDLSKNSKLEMLFAEGNNIKSIDLRNCAKLRKAMKQHRFDYDDVVQWCKYNRSDDSYEVLLSINPKTTLTSGKKVLYRGK